MSSTFSLSIAPWRYLDIAAPVPVTEPVETELLPEARTEPPGISQEESEARVQAALSEAQGRWQALAREEQQQRDADLADTLRSFAVQRNDYFKKLEAEVVQLTLAIARKILHREAELDPTLLTGLVRIALDRIGAEPPIRIRVPPPDVATWKRASSCNGVEDKFSVLPDEELSAGDCIVETISGSANLSIEFQLKEVEQSFLHLLARRPDFG